MNIPLYLIPLLSIAAYAVALGAAVANKPMAVKTFSRLGAFGNIVILALVVMAKGRLPMGGAFELCNEAALIVGLLYALFIPWSQRRLAIGFMAVSLLVTAACFLQGMAFYPDYYINFSKWFQAERQLHLLLNGFLLFTLVCYGAAIFARNEEDMEAPAFYASKSVFAALLIFIIMLAAGMAWQYTVNGEILLWEKDFMLKGFMLVFLAAPLLTGREWFKDLKHKVKFDAVAVLLVLTLNVAEWGGVL